ncbi:hypothetical protein DPEC_G00141990 [Dallia pectoralis]|uniref:Uncharacterized protein n=1 Tax=Dallia pectoralis TaxID=75939 RepID=A0ACC2GNF6_DALPE|nr:hypothetical protein DPEC_G00141990 [Dallia pectoralis]
MINRTCPLSPPPPPEFSSCLDLSALRWKLFSLSTSDSVSQSAQVPTRRRRAVVHGGGLAPSLSLIEELGGANIHWSPTQFSMVNAFTFTSAIETLGAIRDYSTEQLGVLREKTIEVWGPVSGLNESHVVRLGCVAQGFNHTELRSLPLSSLDTLETLAHCSWTQPQREAVWRCFAAHANKTARDLGAVELVGLDQFICGLNAAEISQLHADAFREAVQSVGQVRCPLAVMEHLKQLAVSVFGEAQGWTEAQVTSMGNIMAGLSMSELRVLSPSALSFLTPTSIPLIPPDRFAALSAMQLEALGLDNAVMVTTEQKAVLGEAQRAALGSVLGVASKGAEAIPNPPGNLLPSSGASLLGTLGVGVFLQPFLFLLLGFVL